MTRHQDDDVIGTRKPDDLGPLFTQSPTPAEAEEEIRRDFLEPHVEPAPAPRAQTESQSFTPPTDRERHDAIERIKHELREPLVELARSRKDSTEKDLIGVTAQDARAIADRRGLSTLLGEQQRAWSWLSAWLGDLARSAHLVKYRIHGQTMRRMGDNGNEHVIYLHPYDHRARTAA